MGFFFFIIAVLIILGVLAVFAKEFLSEKPKPGKLPYHKKDYLLTQAERSFYGVLEEAIDSDLNIFAKVRLADLVYLPKGTQNWQSHQNRVNAKHADFVLCDKKKLSPVLAIELDDSSHKSSSRQERDNFVNEVFRTAGLPLLRITAKRSYVSKELSEMIQKEIGKVNTKNETTEAPCK